MILRSAYLLATALFSFTFADVEVTSPKPGDTITGLSLAIEWKDSGDTPAIADLASYQIFLCAGGNDPSQYIQLATLEQQGSYADGDSLTVTLQAGWGANVENAYFLKFISAATGGTVENFSDRFSLKSMTGTFPQSVTQGLRRVSGVGGPDTVNNIKAPQAGDTGNTATAADDSAYDVPYTLQTGTIRYAPMPPMAKTQITAKNASPQFPTSAYTVYHKIAGTPNAITTNTLPLTFSAVSREATVAAAGQPTDAAAQKFLNRWKD